MYKDPAVAELFERIQELRASYLNDQLENEPMPENSDVENAREVDNDYFREAKSKKKRSSPKCGSTPATSAPSTPAAAPAAAPATAPATAPAAAASAGVSKELRMRSIPSIDRGLSEVTATPPCTPRAVAQALPDFTPPDMSEAEKAELTKVLQQIAMLELKAHFGCSIPVVQIHEIGVHGAMLAQVAPMHIPGSWRPRTRMWSQLCLARKAQDIVGLCIGAAIPRFSAASNMC